ncbi:MAG: mobile mystery protein A [Gemmatimonadota bacterium]
MKDLQLRQIDTKLRSLAKLRTLPVPPKGWIHDIRGALGMSLSQLGGRLKMSHSAISQLERGEVEGSITLKTLQKVAAGLHCELVYALLPVTSLGEYREQEARRVATETIDRVGHTMVLENQAVSAAERSLQIEDLTQELLRERPREIWNAS